MAEYNPSRQPTLREMAGSGNTGQTSFDYNEYPEDGPDPRGNIHPQYANAPGPDPGDR